MQDAFSASKTFPYYKTEICPNNLSARMPFHSLIWAECFGRALFNKSYPELISEFSAQRKTAIMRRVRREDTDAVNVKDILSPFAGLSLIVEIIARRVQASSILDIGCDIQLSKLPMLTCVENILQLSELNRAFDIVLLSFHNESFGGVLYSSMQALSSNGILLIYNSQYNMQQGLRGPWYFTEEVIPKLRQVATYFGTYTVSILNSGGYYIIVRKTCDTEIPLLSTLVPLQDKLTIDRYVPILSVYEMHDWITV